MSDRARELAESFAGVVERELDGHDPDWMDMFTADLATALTAAEERGRREINLAVAKSAVGVLIPADPYLAERFLADFNDRKATPPAGEPEGGPGGEWKL